MTRTRMTANTPVNGSENGTNCAPIAEPRFNPDKNMARISIPLSFAFAILCIGLTPIAQGQTVLDSDGDGLSNQDELHQFRTNPFKIDTDDDGNPDPEEVNDPELNPFNPSVYRPRRLLYLNFEGSNGQNPDQVTPRVAEHIAAVDGWIFGGNRFAPSAGSRLNFPPRKDDLSPLVNARQGSVRFWYRPDWSSRSVGGTGPQSFARLLEMGENSSNFNQGWWALYLNPFSDRILFASKGTGFAIPQISAPITFHEGEWYQIVFNYTGSQTSLFINGRQIATGQGIRQIPSDADMEASGLWIGSASTGDLQANGTIDELESFNYTLAPANIRTDYEATQTDSDQDGLSDFLEILVYQTDHTKADTDGDGISDLAEIQAGTSPDNPSDFPALRLALFDFNDGSFSGERGQLPTKVLNVDWIRSWNQAAVRIGARSPSVLSYAFQEEDLSANLNLKTGTVRFWIAPNWHSGESTDGVGRLLEVGQWTPDGSHGWWALQFSSDRDRLDFITQGDGQSLYNISHPIDWRPDRWYHDLWVFKVERTA